MNRYWQNKIAQLVCLMIGGYAASVLVAKFAPPLRWDISKPEVAVEFASHKKDEASVAGDGGISTAPSPAVNVFPVEVLPKEVLTRPVPETPLPLPETPAISPDEVLAPLDPREVLPTPPTIGEYPEERFGNVLVYQITVNEHNLVVDSELKVPSYDGLMDISFVTGAFGQRVEDVYPPIAKGELRKMDIRVVLPEELSEAKERVDAQKRIEAGLPAEQEPFIPPELLLP